MAEAAAAVDVGASIAAHEPRDVKQFVRQLRLAAIDARLALAQHPPE